MTRVITPANIYVLCGLVALDRASWTYRELAKALDVPVPLVQRSLGRAAAAGLYQPESKRVHYPNFEEFTVHAARFVAPAALGEIVPGVRAAWAAQPLSDLIAGAGDELPPVWPSASGRVRGQALQPLHDAAVRACEQWPRLAELLAAVDSLRAGDLRVRSVASGVVRDLLREVGSPRR